MKLWSHAVLALCCLAGPLQAMELLGGVSARYERSDNILRVDQGKQDEDMLAPRVDLTMVEESGRVRGSATAYVERVDYRNDLNTDETRYSLATAWTADLIENRLLWVLEDVAGRRLLDTRDVDIGDNRSDQNVLNTGPDLRFSAGPRDELLLSLRYGNAWYGQNTGFDNERYTGGLRLRHQLTPISSASVGYTRSRTDYEDDLVVDYDREETSVILERTLTRSQVSVEGGYNRVLSENNESYDGVLGRVSWRQQWRETFYTRVYGGTELTDTAQQTIENALQGGVDVDLLTSADIYRRYNTGVLAGWQARSWRGDIGASFEQQKYQTLPLDQSVQVIEFALGRRLNERSELTVSGDVARREYDQANRQDDELQITARLNHLFSSRFFGAIGVTSAHRESNIAFADFIENTVFIEFGLRQSLLARERGREIRHQGQAVY